MRFLVTIEGIDGAGKTTQAELLRAQIAASGIPVALRSFPAYDSFLGRQIRQMLHESPAGQISALDARTISLWFAADRHQALKRDPVAADVEIFNRYTLSNAVYQSSRVPEADRRAVFDWILALEHKELGLPVPDLILVLDVTPDLVAERTRLRAERAGHEPDQYERHGDLQERVRAGYLDAARRDEAIVVVPCDERAPEAIAADVLAEFRRRVP